MDKIDYANTGLNIAQSKIDQAKRFPDREKRPDYIEWNGLHVQTYDWWDVPKVGLLCIEFIEASDAFEQGVDIKLEEGGVRLVSGEMIPILRTWKDDRFEDTVEYRYETGTGRLCVWNVYKVKHNNGRVSEEKWTENAGFWVEKLSKHCRIYHCSPGAIGGPDFSQLIFKVTVG